MKRFITTTVSTVALVGVFVAGVHALASDGVEYAAWLAALAGFFAMAGVYRVLSDVTAMREVLRQQRVSRMETLRQAESIALHERDELDDASSEWETADRIATIIGWCVEAAQQEADRG